MTLQAFVDHSLSDVRYAVRRLWNAPGFTAVALLTLALGLGVNTAIFTLTQAVLLQTLPVTRPHELYSLGDAVLNGDTTILQDSFTLYSYPLYGHLRERLSGRADVTAFQSWLATVSTRRVGVEERPTPARVEYVAGNYFEVFGVRPAAGRLLTDDDDRPQSPATAVVSYAVWARGGRDRTMIGSTIAVNGVPVTIAGVAPSGFFGETLRADPPDYWLPLSLEPATTIDNPLLHKDEVFWLYTLARIPRSQPLTRISDDVTREVRQWLIDHRLFSDGERPRIGALRVALTSAATGIGGLQRVYGEGLRLLTVLSALVLVIACVNIANLLLASGAGRRSQFAIHVALGATRARLIGQTITEGLVLSILGAAAGLAVGTTMAPAVASLALHGAAAPPLSTTPSPIVFAYTFALAAITGLAFSALPAWRGSDPHPAEALRGAGRGTRDSVSRSQRWLLAGQTAFSLVLLVGAGLLTATLHNLQQQPLGFARERIVVVSLNPALDGYSAEQLPILYRRFDERLPRIPGIVSASYALHAPLDDWNWGARLQFDGQTPAADAATANRASYSRVSAHFFETIGTRVRRGRAIDEHDTNTTARVAVVNEAFAARFFPNEDPIGHRFGSSAAGHGRDFEIVGVVEDAKYRDVRQPAEPMFFLPFTQSVPYESPLLASYQRWSMFIDGIQLRFVGTMSSIRSQVERALADIDPNLTILRIRSLDAFVDVQLNSPRLLASLTIAYGLLALVLASVGLYGVTAYMVARRTRDLGVRIALGATAPDVVGSVCRDALAPVAAGLVVGVPAAIAAGHAMASQLYGVSGTSAMILTGAGAVLAFSAVAAAVIPAMRAARIDPMLALRAE